MTKEELYKEAGNWLRKYLLCCNCEKKCNCIDSNSYCEEQVLKAYIDSAEPREKRIAELEEENRALVSGQQLLKETLEKENAELILGNKSLSAKLMNTIREKLDLQKENAELKEKLEITDLALDNCLKDSEVEK